MKSRIDIFYTKYHPYFEILAVLLVVSGLIINKQISYDIVGKSIEHLKFLLLSFSSLMLIYILLQFVREVVFPSLLGVVKKDTYKNSIELISSLFLVVTALCFFLFNLLIYIIFSFPRDSLYLMLLVLWYLFMNLLSRLEIDNLFNGKKFITILFLFSLLAMLSIPVALYYFLFFGFEHSIIVYLVAAGYVASIIGLFIKVASYLS